MTSTSSIVISGVGALTPLGCNISEHLAAHQQGESGLRAKHGLPFQQGDVPSVNLKQWIPDKKSCRMLTRQGMLGIASATLAIQDAGLCRQQLTEHDDQNGVIYGAFYSQGVLNAAPPYLKARDSNGQIDYHAFGKQHYRDFAPLWILPRLPNTTGGQISIQYGLRGLSYSVVNGPAGGMIAVGEAMACIADGRARRMITGASEMDPTLEQLYALDQAGVLATTQPEKAGLTVSEAGVSFVVESLALAHARHVSPYAKIMAYENSYIPNITQQTPAQLTQQIKAHLERTLNQAGMNAAALDAIQLTLAGIPEQDHAQASAVHQLFGEQISVVCASDYTGFALGAAAATNLFYACLQLKHQYLAPVLAAETKPLADKLNYPKTCQHQANIQTLLCYHIDHLGNQVSLLLKHLPNPSIPARQQEVTCKES